MGYTLPMPDPNLPATDVALARQRRLAAARLQEIEGNPLSADQLEMFEMFEREAWSHERRRAYLLARALPLAAQ
jgi:hypothetical protein